VLGQAHSPWRRLLSISIAASCVLAAPAVSGADPTRSTSGLESENVSLESQSRSAVLSLYALDSRLAAARSRLAGLEAEADKLRVEQVILAKEMKVALVGARVSQQRLAARIRLLFDHGDTSTLEVLFGARSLDEALVEIDNLNRVASINQEVLTQLQAAKQRVRHASRALAARTARIAAATRAQVATTRALEVARADRAAYIADLRQQMELNSLQISRIEAQARTAQVQTEQLIVTRTTATGSPASVVPFAPTPVSVSGRTMTVSAVAYSLPGRTASGLPVGWGVVAVDPSVIPLGTHITVPGYGEAVAADTGTAIKGAIIDLWFPTYALAAAWGRKSVTITLD
jgi:3D (Asp-Asp-Asp) domain-containing protein